MVNAQYIRLSQWASQHGMHRMTVWRHYQAGALPPELQPRKIGNIICVLANPRALVGRIVGYAPGEQQGAEATPGKPGQQAVGLRWTAGHPAGRRGLRDRQWTERPPTETP